MRPESDFDRGQSDWKKYVLLPRLGMLLSSILLSFFVLSTVLSIVLSTVSLLALGTIVSGFAQPAFGQPLLVSPQISAYPTVELSLDLTIVSIDAEISQATQTTQVSIRSVGSLLEEIDFQLPVTEFSAIEQSIARELNLSPTLIHPLMRYRID